MKSNVQVVGSVALALLVGGCGAETMAPNLVASEAPLVRAASRRTPLAASQVLAPGGARKDQLDRVAARVSLPREGGAAACHVAGEAGAVLQVSAQPAANVPTKHLARFSRTSRSVYLNALLVNVCGAHVATFDLYAPSGEFYARLSRPFDTAGAGVRSGSEGHIIEMELPVAGSAIESLQLYGAFSINFTLDGSGLAVGLGEFEITAE